MDGWLLAPIPGCLGSGLLWFGGGFLLLRIFGVAISVSPHVCLVSVFPR